MTIIKNMHNHYTELVTKYGIQRKLKWVNSFQQIGNFLSLIQIQIIERFHQITNFRISNYFWIRWKIRFHWPLKSKYILIDLLNPNFF